MGRISVVILVTIAFLFFAPLSYAKDSKLYLKQYKINYTGFSSDFSYTFDKNRNTTYNFPKKITNDYIGSVYAEKVVEYNLKVSDFSILYSHFGILKSKFFASGVSPPDYGD